MLLSAIIEEIIRYHPASQFGRLECRQSDLGAFEELKMPLARRRHEYEPEYSKPTWMIGDVAAAAALGMVFCGVLALIAQSPGEPTNTAQQPVVAVSNATDSN
jgi:hypothetical protein